MAGKRKSKVNADAKQAVKAVREQVKATRASVKELRGADLRAFRSQVAALRKAGVVSKRVDARSQKATRYMRAKIRAFDDVLKGLAVPIKATPNQRAAYVDSGVYKERGRFLIVPKEDAKDKARFSKGRVVTTTPLKNGSVVRIVLPFKPTDIIDLADRLEENPELVEDYLGDGEMFAFRLYGHNSTKSFVDVEEFLEHVRLRYKHLFVGDGGQRAIKNLQIIRFSTKGGQGPIIPEPRKGEPGYQPKQYDMPRRKDMHERTRTDQYKLNRQAARQRKARDNETEEQYNARLDKQKLRQARYRQRKFEDE